MSENDKREMNNLAGHLLHEIVTVERHKRRLIELAVSWMTPTHGKQQAERIIRQQLNELFQ